MRAKHSMTDWTMFASASLFWASAFAFNKTAVETLPPYLIIPARLGLAAIILIIVMYMRGERFPPLTERRQWLFMGLIGTVGTALPFFMITWGQKTVDSSLAALYVTTSPLVVVAVAHFIFKDERMTPLKAAGTLLGLLGVGVLFGPDAVRNFGSADVFAQSLCLAGAICYGASTLLARAAPPIPPLTMAAGFVSLGALASLPMLALVDWQGLQPSSVSIGAVLALGLIPTAGASIVYMSLVQRTDATFVSLTSYAIPVISVIIGWLVFREVQSWNALLAFTLILAGIWLAQTRGRADAVLTAEKPPQ